MLELLMSSGKQQPDVNFTITHSNNDIAGGESSYFTVAEEDGYLGSVFYWAIEGAGAQYITTATQGKFTVGEGTRDISFDTEDEDGTTDINSEVYLVIRGGSQTGPEIIRSETIPLTYRQFPIGQESFIVTGSVDFIVPEDVYSLCAVNIGAGQGAENKTRGRGGIGGDLRWSNDIEVTPGETLTLEIGKGGSMSDDPELRNGGSTVLRRGDEVLLRASGGGRDESTTITIGKEDNNWVIPTEGYVIGGGDGGLVANALEDNGPSGGGGAGGYLGNGGRGGDRTTGATDGQDDSGAAGGGAYYYTESNDSHHATAGGGVGLHGRGVTGDQGTRGEALEGGRAGSGGEDGTWTQAGLYGGGAKGRSSNNNFGAINGANGAARLIWGANRRFPSTRTDNL